MADDFENIYTGLNYRPLSADPTNPKEGDVFRSDGTSRSSGFWEWNNGSWKPLGGGAGGGLDVIHTQTFETDISSSSFTSGQNVTYKTAGTFGGTLSDDTVTPISGDLSPEYTAGASSTNDWFDIESIPLDVKQKGEFLGITLYADTSNFTVDSEFVVWDETNNKKLTTSLDVLTASTDKSRYSFVVFIPINTASISYGFHMVNAPVNTESFKFDDFEFTLNPFVYKNLLNEGARVVGFGDPASTVNTAFVTNIKFVESIDTDNTWNDTQFTAPRDGLYTVTGSIHSVASITRDTFLYVDAVQVRRVHRGTTADVIHDFEFQEFLNKGEVLSLRSDTGFTNFNDISHYISITEQPYISEHLIVPSQTNMTDWVQFTPTATSFGTITGAIGYWRRIGDSMEIKGSFQSGSPIAAAGSLGIPAGHLLDLNKIDAGNSEFLGTVTRLAGTNVIYSNVDFAGNLFSDDTDDSQIFIGLRAASNTSHVKTIANTFLTSGSTATFRMVIPIAGWSSDSNFLAAIPVQRTAFVKDIKASGTDGGTFTLGDWRTRDLNTIEGDDEIVIVSGNQFTLQKGKYLIEANAPAFQVEYHKGKLRNITDSTDDILGSSEYSNPTGGNADSTKTNIRGIIEITSAKTYQIQHYCETTGTTTGFGLANAVPLSETYTQIKITKLR